MLDFCRSKKTKDDYISDDCIGSDNVKSIKKNTFRAFCLNLRVFLVRLLMCLSMTECLGAEDVSNLAKECDSIEVEKCAEFECRKACDSKTEGDKKVLIAMYTNGDETVKLVQSIRDKIVKANIGSDVHRIRCEELSSPNTQILGNMKKSVYAIFDKSAKINAFEGNVDDYDGIVLVFPIWTGAVATPMKEFIKEVSNKIGVNSGKKIYIFVRCRSSDAALIKNTCSYIEKKFRTAKAGIVVISRKDSKADGDLIYPANTKKVEMFAENIIQTIHD